MVEDGSNKIYAWFILRYSGLQVNVSNISVYWDAFAPGVCTTGVCILLANKYH